MKWTKITIKTTTEAEDIIISTLYDIGLEGAQIEDKQPLTAWEKEQMFVDILPDMQEDDGVAYLNFFVEVPSDDEAGQDGVGAQASAPKEQAGQIAAGLTGDADNSYFAVPSGKVVDLNALLEQIKKELDDLRCFIDIGAGEITVSETEDKDWVNNWKEYFHQFYVGDLLVTPSWEEVRPEDQGKRVLHIDPGTAFGTGAHETTQLCIKALTSYVTEDTVLLDVGTGSGILGIVALLYGAKAVVGTDLDPFAAEAVEENLEMNQLGRERFEMMIGNIISDRQVQDRVGYEKYDIVVANILAEVLVPLTAVIVKQMKPGAVYITSGILNGKEKMVERACEEAGLKVLAVERQGEWMSVTAQKQG